jgi:acylphosphatase
MRCSFHAHGRVQGVGFRWFVLGEAHALGLAGWVRNEGDGTVSGVAEGEPPVMARFRDLLASGPASSHVSRLDWHPLDGAQSLPLPFEVRR